MAKYKATLNGVRPIRKEMEYTYTTSSFLGNIEEPIGIASIGIEVQNAISKI